VITGSGVQMEDSPSIDDIAELLLILVGGDEDNANNWMFGYNRVFEDSPVNMIKDGKLKEVYKYLQYMVEGPY
jgi:hypothetical protein